MIADCDVSDVASLLPNIISTSLSKLKLKPDDGDDDVATDAEAASGAAEDDAGVTVVADAVVGACATAAGGSRGEGASGAGTLVLADGAGCADTVFGAAGAADGTAAGLAPTSGLAPTAGLARGAGDDAAGAAGGLTTSLDLATPAGAAAAAGLDVDGCAVGAASPAFFAAGTRWLAAGAVAAAAGFDDDGTAGDADAASAAGAGGATACSCFAPSATIFCSFFSSTLDNGAAVAGSGSGASVDAVRCFLVA